MQGEAERAQGVDKEDVQAHEERVRGRPSASATRFPMNVLTERQTFVAAAAASAASALRCRELLSVVVLIMPD